MSVFSDWVVPEPDFQEEADTVPHSARAEEAILGGVFINPDALYDAETLQPDDFYIRRNRTIWEAFLALNSQGLAVDLLTVSEYLEKRGLLADIGGPAYLTELISHVPSSLNVGDYARIVEDYSARRKMISAANKIVQAAYSDTLTVEQARELANKEITEVQNGRIDEEGAFSGALSKIWDRASDNADRISRGEPVKIGIKTGISDLDGILLGIEDEESVIIAGRPGQGKTSLLFDIARHNILSEKKNVAIFSLEMSNEEVARRFISQHAKIDSNKVKTGSMTPAEWERFSNAIEIFENGGKIFLFDASNLTPAQLRAKCLRVKRQHGLDLVILDYMQLMSAGVRSENRTREIGYISRYIKLLVKEIKAPIISACQMSRAAEQRTDKRPILSDLRDSGDLEQDANCVIFLHREDQYSNTNNTTECIVAKRRDGQVGMVELIYRKEFTTFACKSYKFSPNEDVARHAQTAQVGSED